MIVAARLAIAALAIIAGTSLAAIGPAIAHESRPVYLGLDQLDDGQWRVTWKRPMRGDGVLQLSPFLPAVCTATGDMLALQQDGALVEMWNIACPETLEGETLAVDGIEGLLTDVLVRIAHENGHVQIARLSPDSPSIEFASNAGRIALAETYAALGVRHILFGYDHLLFVALLVLVSGTPRRMLLSVTGFTIAHSLTLALATFDAIDVPVPLVEALIALSIVALAAEIVLHDRNSLTWRAPILVSSLFGLLHGMGFASALRETGIPSHEVPLSLLFFNVGVEIGQIAFVAVLLAGFAIRYRLSASGRSWKFAAPQPGTALTYGLVYPIGALAGFWTIERTLSFL